MNEIAIAMHIRYTYTGYMPNKTIYVKESDLQLFEQVQEQLGDSVSSMFSDFLRERVTGLNPAENRIAGMLEQIGERRQAVKADRDLPAFVDGAFAEAQTHAEKALKKLRADKIKGAKISLWTANSYLELADKNLKQAKEINGKINEMAD
jgi:hypothetical protein